MTGPENANLAFPRLIAGPYQGKAWLVAECDAHDSATTPSLQRLQIPRAITGEDLATQLHELAHVERFDGQVPPDLGCNGIPMHDMFRKMAEEVAIETIKYREGYGPVMYRCRDHYDWAEYPYPQSRHDLAGMWLQLAGSVPHTLNPDLRGYFESVHKLSRPADVKLLQECLGDLQRDTSHQNCVKWSGLLTAHFTPPAEPPKRPDKKTKEQEEAEEEQEDLDQEKEEAARQRDGDGDDESTEGKEHQNAQTSKGTLDIHRHTAGRRGTQMAAPRWAPTDSAGTVRYPRNLYRGARMFGVRQRGGSILVDISISMDWSPAQLEAASKLLPQLWVAAYSAHTERHMPRGPVARLCIVASNGRIGSLDVLRESQQSKFNADTGADFAVLEWAARFAPKPLVWVSDGGVGVDPRYCDDVDRITRAHHIPRVSTIGDAIRFLAGHTVRGYAKVPRCSPDGASWNMPPAVQYHR